MEEWKAPSRVIYDETPTSLTCPAWQWTERQSKIKFKEHVKQLLRRLYIHASLLGLSREHPQIPNAPRAVIVAAGGNLGGAILSLPLLEDKDKFQRLRPGRKQLIDTVRMVAYRTETAMAGLLRSETVDMAEARQLLIDLFSTEADILPDKDKKILRVRIHGASRPAANRSLDKLLTRLNESEVIYPGTDLRMCYELGVKKG